MGVAAPRRPAHALAGTSLRRVLPITGTPSPTRASARPSPTRSCSRVSVDVGAPRGFVLALVMHHATRGARPSASSSCCRGPSRPRRARSSGAFSSTVKPVSSTSSRRRARPRRAAGLARRSAAAWVPIIAADVWKTTPFVALLLLAGLKGIDRSLYDAARVDGAAPWRSSSRSRCRCCGPRSRRAGISGARRVSRLRSDLCAHRRRAGHGDRVDLALHVRRAAPEAALRLRVCTVGDCLRGNVRPRADLHPLTRPACCRHRR